MKQDAYVMGLAMGFIIGFLFCMALSGVA